MTLKLYLSKFPIAFDMIPRKDTAESLFPLAVLEVGCISVVGRQHRKFPVGVDIPCVQA